MIFDCHKKCISSEKKQSLQITFPGKRMNLEDVSIFVNRWRSWWCRWRSPGPRRSCGWRATRFAGSWHFSGSLASSCPPTFSSASPLIGEHWACVSIFENVSVGEWVWVRVSAGECGWVWEWLWVCVSEREFGWVRMSEHVCVHMSCMFGCKICVCACAYYTSVLRVCEYKCLSWTIRLIRLKLYP